MATRATTGGASAPPLDTPDAMLRAVRSATQRYGISPTTFGREAVGDPCFVARLPNKVRGPSRSTQQRIQRYLAELKARECPCCGQLRRES